MRPHPIENDNNEEVTSNPGGIFLPEVGEDGPAPASEVYEAARAYWRCVEDAETASVAAAFEATEAGDRLLTKAGHYRRAVVALRAVWHEAKGIRTYIHGDDFVSSGPGHELKWLKDQLEKKDQLETATRIAKGTLAGLTLPTQTASDPGSQSERERERERSFEMGRWDCLKRVQLTHP